MSLNWDIRNMHGHEQLHEDEREWQITNNLIWSTIAVDMGSITDDNWQEFYARLSTWERLMGYSTEHLTTPQQVRRRIGLVCNVSTTTRLQWMKRMVNTRIDDLKRYADSQVGKDEVA
jgi:hypothetical protein